MSLSRIASAAVLCAVIAGAPLRAQQGTGFTYDLVQKMQASNPMMPGGAGGGDSTGVRARVRVDAAGHTRMDIVQSVKSPMWSAGDYAIVSGTTMTVVSPARKEYLELGADMGMSEINDMMQKTGMNMKMVEGKFAFDTLPESETLLGRPTFHYRMSRDASIEMNTPAGTMSMGLTSTTDYYVVRERAPAVNPMMSQSPASAGPSSMLSPEVTEKIRAAAAGMKGFVVRMINRTTTNVMGMNVEATQSTEVENLQVAPVAPIPLAPPAGYTKVTMSSRMRDLTGG